MSTWGRGVRQMVQSKRGPHPTSLSLGTPPAYMSLVSGGSLHNQPIPLGGKTKGPDSGSAVLFLPHIPLSLSASKPTLGLPQPPAMPPPHLGCWWPCQPLSGRHPRRPQQPAQWSWGDGQWDRLWVRCPLPCPCPPPLGHPQQPHLSWECSFVALELKSSQMG